MVRRCGSLSVWLHDECLFTKNNKVDYLVLIFGLCNTFNSSVWAEETSRRPPRLCVGHFFVCFTSEQVNLPLVRFTEFIKNLIGKLSLHYINKLYNLEPLCSLVSALKYSHLHIFACVNVRRTQRAGLSGRSRYMFYETQIKKQAARDVNEAFWSFQSVGRRITCRARE